MTLPGERDHLLERGRLRIVIATIVINIIAISLLTFAPWSDWRTGAALNVIDDCLLVGFAVVRRDALFARFLLFLAVVGFTELAADVWLVDLGEFGIALVFALLTRTLRRASWRVAVVAGILGGLFIFARYAIAFLVTDELIKL